MIEKFNINAARASDPHQKVSIGTVEVKKKKSKEPVITDELVDESIIRIIEILKAEKVNVLSTVVKRLEEKTFIVTFDTADSKEHFILEYEKI